MPGETVPEAEDRAHHEGMAAEHIAAGPEIRPVLGIPGTFTSTEQTNSRRATLDSPHRPIIL